MLLCELQCKNVVNVCTARCLGRVMDLEFDPCSGEISTIIVPKPGKWFGFFFRESEYWIPWKCIRSIGKDIVLVEVNEREVCRNP